MMFIIDILILKKIQSNRTGIASYKQVSDKVRRLTLFSPSNGLLKVDNSLFPFSYGLVIQFII
jgi:hypothetical protein